MSSTLLTPGERLAQLAADRPDDAAVVVGHVDGTDETVTWDGLERRSNRAMRLLAQHGVTAESVVAVVLPNSVDHVVASTAALKLGACVMPIDPRAPAAERQAMLDLAGDPVVIGDTDGAPDRIGPAALAAPDLDDAPPDGYPVPDPWKAVGSGGSTGRKKLIVSRGPAAYPVGGHPMVVLGETRPDDTIYMTGPLHHNQAFVATHAALFGGATAVLNERFRPELAYRLIREHRVTVISTVPTVMQRMLRHDPEGEEDVSSLRLLWHMAAMCPAWAKRGWIDRIGARAVRELWGATEMNGLTVIDGEEWLERPGSVGRGWNTDIRILDEAGDELPTGEVGQLWTRLGGGPALHTYLGSDPLPATEDGFSWVGDLAHVDEDGYLYLSDRRVDLIITGGANVYPAEVEAVITADPRVADAAVVGLADPDLGQVVHAIVEPASADDVPTAEEVRARCAANLTSYKVPRTVRFVDALPRDDAGKLRRRALLD